MIDRMGRPLPYSNGGSPSGAVLPAAIAPEVLAAVLVGPHDRPLQLPRHIRPWHADEQAAQLLAFWEVASRDAVPDLLRSRLYALTLRPIPPRAAAPVSHRGHYLALGLLGAGLSDEQIGNELRVPSGDALRLVQEGYAALLGQVLRTFSDENRRMLFSSAAGMEHSDNGAQFDPPIAGDAVNKRVADMAARLGTDVRGLPGLLGRYARFHPDAPPVRTAGMDPPSLTTSDRLLLDLAAQGHTWVSSAALLDTTENALRNRAVITHSKFGVHSSRAAVLPYLDLVTAGSVEPVLGTSQDNASAATLFTAAVAEETRAAARAKANRPSPKPTSEGPGTEALRPVIPDGDTARLLLPRMNALTLRPRPPAREVPPLDAARVRVLTLLTADTEPVAIARAVGLRPSELVTYLQDSYAALLTVAVDSFSPRDRRMLFAAAAGDSHARNAAGLHPPSSADYVRKRVVMLADRLGTDRRGLPGLVGRYLLGHPDARPVQSADNLDELTTADRLVLELRSQNLSVKNCAQLLRLAEDPVKDHSAMSIRLLGAANLADAQLRYLHALATGTQQPVLASAQDNGRSADLFRSSSRRTLNRNTSPRLQKQIADGVASRTVRSQLDGLPPYVKRIVPLIVGGKSTRQIAAAVGAAAATVQDWRGQAYRAVGLQNRSGVRTASAFRARVRRHAPGWPDRAGHGVWLDLASTPGEVERGFLRPSQLPSLDVPSLSEDTIARLIGERLDQLPPWTQSLLPMLLTGFSSVEIARASGLAPHTVDTGTRLIYRYLEIRERRTNAARNVLSALVTHYVPDHPALSPRSHVPLLALAEQERHVMDLRSLGLPRDRIAARVGVSRDTVRRRLGVIRDKLLTAEEAKVSLPMVLAVHKYRRLVNAGAAEPVILFSMAQVFDAVRPAQRPTRGGPSGPLPPGSFAAPQRHAVASPLVTGRRLR